MILFLLTSHIFAVINYNIFLECPKKGVPRQNINSSKKCPKKGAVSKKGGVQKRGTTGVLFICKNQNVINLKAHLQFLTVLSRLECFYMITSSNFSELQRVNINYVSLWYFVLENFASSICSKNLICIPRFRPFPSSQEI